MTLPTFFIVGAAKAGTTSLYHCLDQHPQIQVSPVKEPHFFAPAENGIPSPPGRIESLEEYEQLFDPSFEARGEASQSYTNFPRRNRIPERIEELVPDARFLYLVRDPIARTVSHYRHWVATGKECRPLRDVLKDPYYPYSYLTCHSLYARQLELYLRRFPEEQIMVIDQADLLADPQSTLRKVFAFLAVDDSDAYMQLDFEQWRCRDRSVPQPAPGQVAGGVRAPRRPRVAVRRIRRYARPPLGKIFRLPPKVPTLDAESRARLEALYTDEMERLRALTGMTFPTWSI